MKTVNLIQGSPEWHAHRKQHFNASDAPAMMGCSSYTTRTELLKKLALGTEKVIDAGTQRKFDNGHRYEALARPLAEAIIGEPLSPVVGVNGQYSASFDGVTFMADQGFEHKTLNDTLRAVMVNGCTGADLPMEYQVQMESQCLVNEDMDRVLFMASQFNEKDELIESRHCWYIPNQELRAKIVAGWAQFALDLADYTPAAEVIAPTAAPQTYLPAVSVQITGNLAVIDNLSVFGDALTDYVARINKQPETDQDFADLEATVKTLKAAEDALSAAESNAVAQSGGLDALRRTIGQYRDLARANRLTVEKLVKAEKENRRNAIVQAGKNAMRAHIDALNKRLGGDYLGVPIIDFSACIKGLKTISSIKNSVDTELANIKIDYNARADKIQINLDTIREAGHAHLFADTGNLILKSPEDLVLLIGSRIADEKARIEAQAKAAAERERDRIAAEERAKVEAEQREAAANRLRAEELERHANATAAAARQVTEQHAPTGPTLADISVATAKEVFKPSSTNGRARLNDRLNDLVQKMTDTELSDLVIHATHMLAERRVTA